MTTVTYPVVAAPTPLRGTLLDAAQEAGDFAWADVVGLFDSYNCMKFEESAEFCAPNAKTLDQIAGWQDGLKFAAYGGAVCKAIGLDQDRMLSEAERVFASGESTAIERALMEHRFVANADGAPLDGQWAAPVDITPAGGAVKPKVGIALLEGHAADNYVGSPTLHVPRTIASLLVSVDGLVFSGDMLQTKLGSKVAAGAGYDYPNTGPTGAAAADGEKWVYATGNVLVTKGELFARQMMDPSTNEVFVLAERPYIVAVDCYTAAIRVTVQD